MSLAFPQPFFTAHLIKNHHQGGKGHKRQEIGEAPVEKDGSFFVNPPSETPIRFELLDRTGKVTAAEKSWFWTRRGEQRVCVGCHAGPERAPENAVPQVLLRSTDPVKMTMHGGLK